MPFAIRKMVIKSRVMKMILNIFHQGTLGIMIFGDFFFRHSVKTLKGWLNFFMFQNMFIDHAIRSNRQEETIPKCGLK